MPSMDVTANVVSTFAFIMVLGIVVDDAIIVGENIHRHPAARPGARRCCSCPNCGDDHRRGVTVPPLTGGSSDALAIPVQPLLNDPVGLAHFADLSHRISCPRW